MSTTPSSITSVVTKVSQKRKPCYSLNVSHMPGLSLLDIGGAYHIGHKIMPQKVCFTFDFSATTSRCLGGAS